MSTCMLTIVAVTVNLVPQPPDSVHEPDVCGARRACELIRLLFP